MSSRHKLLQSDIRYVIQTLEEDRNCPFQELTFEPLESTLSFSCIHGQEEDEVTEVIFYTVVTNEDYPDRSMLTCSLFPNEPDLLNDRIPTILIQLAEEHGHHLNLSLPKVVTDADLILDKGGGGGNANNKNIQDNLTFDQSETTNLPDVVKTNAMSHSDYDSIGAINIHNRPFQQALPVLCDTGSDGLMYDPELCSTAAKRRNIDKGDVDNRLNCQMEIHESTDILQSPVHESMECHNPCVVDASIKHNTLTSCGVNYEDSNFVDVMYDDSDSCTDSSPVVGGQYMGEERSATVATEYHPQDMCSMPSEVSHQPSMTIVTDSHDGTDVDGLPVKMDICGKSVQQDDSHIIGDQEVIDVDEGLSEDQDDYYDESEDDFYVEEPFESEDEVVEMHPLLRHDMEQVSKHYGTNAVTCRTFDTLGDIDVELHIDVSFLEEEIAKAWCIDRKDSLTCRLHCSLNKYLDANLPKVEVFQKTKQGPSGICSQVRKIAETFLLRHWKGITNDFVQATLKTVPSPARSPSNNKRIMQDASVARLVDMGFGVEAACGALNLSKGLVDEAAHLLCTQPELCTSPNAQGSSGSKFVKRLFSRSKSTSPNQVPCPSHHSSSSSLDSNTCITVSTDLHLIPAVTQNGKNAKVVPTLEYGFLHQIYTYLRNRIPTLSEFCVVCDEQHIFQNGAMLKPAVCERELCVFSFQTLGVMQDAAENIATGAEVVDLMVAMVASSIKSHRRHLIFDPYPMVVDPRNAKEFAFTPKKKNYDRIQQALDSFISIREMLAAGNSCDVKKKMDHADILAYPLLQWIISSNRSHIVKLPETRQIRFMHTAHQFLLLSSPPAKEALFRKAKQTHGSVFAFHGSHIENWHSILRHGLINASGTKHQMHGAVYGKGIYLSPHSSVSFGYSGMGHGVHKTIRKQSSLGSSSSSGSLSSTPSSSSGDGASPVTENKREIGASENRFLQSKNLTCIALCEVIKSKDLSKHGHVWVCTNPDHVCTRFFFVYEDGKVGDQGVDTTQERFAKDIVSAMADCKAP